ncbi:hypothetical protein Tco_0508237 [Tanacetum coccineum]
MGFDSMANEVAEMNEAWEKGVGIEVDNIGEENIDAGKIEERKVTLHNYHVSYGKQVVLKGKLAQLVKNSKKQAAKGSSSFDYVLNHRVEYLDNIYSMETDPHARYGFLSMTLNNVETYRGEGDRGDLCCLSKEDCNKVKSKVEQETHAFKTLLVEEKIDKIWFDWKRLKAEAFGKIKQRVVQMLK